METSDELKKKLELYRMKRAIRASLPSMRSTMTARNAEEFLPYLRLALTGEDVEIPFTDFSKCAPRTIYQKLCDAFLWLMNCGSDEERQQFTALRGQTILDRREDRIFIRHRREQWYNKRTADAAAKTGQTPAVTNTGSLNWRVEFLNWCETAPADVPFVRLGLSLSADDVQFVKQMLSDIGGCESQVRVDMIKAIKLP